MIQVQEKEFGRICRAKDARASLLFFSRDYVSVRSAVQSATIQKSISNPQPCNTSGFNEAEKLKLCLSVLLARLVSK